MGMASAAAAKKAADESLKAKQEPPIVERTTPFYVRYPNPEGGEDLVAKLVWTALDDEGVASADRLAWLAADGAWAQFTQHHQHRLLSIARIMVSLGLDTPEQSNHWLIKWLGQDDGLLHLVMEEGRRHDDAYFPGRRPQGEGGAEQPALVVASGDAVVGRSEEREPPVAPPG